MVLTAAVRFKKSNGLECHRYRYLLLKNQFRNTLLNLGIGRPSKKCALVSRKSINTSISKKCSNFMCNQQPFHRFSNGYR